jgi:tetratricopeptide (TPR) repeat protein
MNWICRNIFFIIILNCLLLSISCSRESTLTFQLVYPEHDRLSNLPPAESKINQSQYQCFVVKNLNYWVNKKVELDLSDVKDAKFKVSMKYPYEEKWHEVEVSADPFSNEHNISGKGYTVIIYFNEKGHKKLAELTEKNIRRRLAIVIRGKLIMAPLIMEKISDAEISLVGITFDDAKQLNDVICQSSSRCKNKPSNPDFSSFSKYDVDKEIKFFKHEIEKDPQNDQLYVGLGIAYKIQGNMQDALTYFNKAISLNQKNVMAYYQRGLIYGKTGKYADAINDYSKATDNSSVTKDAPLLEDVYFERGYAYGNVGKYIEAINDCDKVIVINPKRLLAYRNRGSYYYHLAKYSDAINDYTKAIEVDSKYADAYYGRGSTYAALNNYQQAIKDYDKAIELDPKHADSFYNRAKAYYQLQNYELAIKDYSKSIEYDPRPDAYCGRGSAYDKLNNLQQAMIDYDKAIGLNPRYAMAYYNKGLNFAHQTKFTLAIKEFDKSISNNPKYADAYFYRGLAYYSLHKYDQALPNYDKAIAIDPKYSDAYCGRGHVYLVRKNFSQAIKDYTKAIELNPTKYFEAYLYRGQAYETSLGKCDLAFNDYVKASEVNPASSDGFNAVAWVLATCIDKKYRDGKKAVQYGEKALKLSENIKDNNRKAEIYDTLAAAYAESGDFTKAALLESKAYELYKPINTDDKSKQDFKNLIETYNNHQTYSQWASKQ